MFGHKKCEVCGELGHKHDMVPYVFWDTPKFFHKTCYEKMFNVKKCQCGKGYVQNMETFEKKKTKIIKSIKGKYGDIKVKMNNMEYHP